MMSEYSQIQPEAGPSTSPTYPYVVGKRYLNSKTNYPLTLRYIGPLPPSSSSSSTTLSSNEQIWLGVEYDTSSNGKGHNGLYKNIQIFQTLEEGSGSFLKYSTKNPILKKGNSLIDSIQERYGKIIPPFPKLVNEESTGIGSKNDEIQDEKIILGSSENSIIVQAPNLSGVKERVGKLEKIKNMGFEEEYIDSLGGDEEIVGVLKERMKGLKWLNLSKNLLSTWDQISEIVDCFEGLEVLTLNHSRFQPIPSDLSTASKDRYISTFSRIRELHLSDCLLSWDKVCHLTPLFPNLEILYLEGNRRLTELSQVPEGLKQVQELRLGGCPLEKWQDLVSSLSPLSKLQSLDLSFTPIASIPPLSSFQATFESVKSLIFLECSIRSWSDLDNLSNYIPNLTNFRFTLSSTPQIANSDQIVNEISEVDDKSLRSICISKFPNLIMFNSNPITSAERKDAELFYISFVKKLTTKHGGKNKDWGRYEELCKIHGVKDTKGDESGKIVKSGMKGRMITLQAHLSLTESFTPKSISILPTAKISLLQRKLIRLFSIPIPASDYQHIQIYNTNFINGENNLGGLEKVNKITNIWEDKEVGWWFGDGDEVFIEVVNERED